jgi:hypothetical protein
VGPDGELERIAATGEGLLETSQAVLALTERQEVLPDLGQRVRQPERAAQIPADPQHLLVEPPGSGGIPQAAVGPAERGKPGGHPLAVRELAGERETRRRLLVGHPQAANGQPRFGQQHVRECLACLRPDCPAEVEALPASGEAGGEVAQGGEEIAEGAQAGGLRHAVP